MTDPQGEPYPGGGAPSPGAVTLRPPRRRARALVVGIISAALVISGAVATVAVLATKTRAMPTATTADASATVSAVPSPTTATTAAPGPSTAPDRAVFTFPQRIGSLTNKTGPDQESTKQAFTGLGVIHAFDEKYEDANGFRTVLLVGGDGAGSGYADMNADQVLDDIIKIAADPAKGKTVGARRSIAAPGAGGTLLCAPIKNVGTVCGWKHDALFVEAVMLNWQPNPGSALVRTMLDAIVVPG